MERRHDAQKRNRGWLWAAGLLMAGGLLMAAPAQASDEFERAFKYELGRIAAHEVVHVGQHVAGAVVVGGYVQYGPGYAYSSGQRYYDGPPHGHAYGHRKHKLDRRHRHHQRHCDYDYGHRGYRH